MSEYHFEKTIHCCPLCASESFSLFATEVNRGTKLFYQICGRCGMVFLSPRMSSEDITLFYKTQYRMGDIEGDKPIQWVIENEKERASYQVGFISDWAKSPHRLLDIGASSGQLLRLASEKFGCDVIGVEPGDVYRVEASRAFKVYPDIETLITAGEARFDIITMSHVLEHLSEPIDFLFTLREHALNVNGALFIEVPNLYWHSCFEPAHLYAFSEETLKMMLRSAGFSVSYTETHNKPNEFGRHNISILAHPSVPRDVPRRFVLPRWIRLQRAIGRTNTRHWYGYLFSKIVKNKTK